MSLLKYVKELDDQGTSNGQPIHTHRMELDRAPYRGPDLPPLKPGEFEKVTKKVADGHVQLFDLTNPEQLAAYQSVIDKVVNGRYIMLSHKEDIAAQPDGKVVAWAFAMWKEEWIEPDLRKLRSFGGPGR